jgi:hypothetical protein
MLTWPTYGLLTASGQTHATSIALITAIGLAEKNLATIDLTKVKPGISTKTDITVPAKAFVAIIRGTVDSASCQQRKRGQL